MKTFNFLIFFLLVGIPVMAQNLGIGTTSPQHKLHIDGSNDVVSKVESSGLNNQAAVFLKTKNNSSDYLQLQKWVAGATGNIAGIPISNLSVVASSFEGGPLMIGTLTNSPFHVVTNSLERLRIMPNGNIGIGAPTAAFKLDVNGRIQLNSYGATAGIWFNNSTNSYSPGFVGMLNDQNIGLYGSGAGWQFLMNVNTGNVSIGATTPGIAKLKVEGGSTDAIEIFGGIMAAGKNAPAFRITADTYNLGDLNKEGMYKSIIIDHPYSNNQPNALLFVIPVSFKGGVPLDLIYDEALNKWKIATRSEAGLIGITTFSYVNCSRQNLRNQNVALADLFGFTTGDSFNVLIINR